MNATKMRQFRMNMLDIAYSSHRKRHPAYMPRMNGMWNVWSHTINDSINEAYFYRNIARPIDVKNPLWSATRT